MVRIQIQFTDAQARELKRVAAERHVSVAALAREAVERMFIENGDTTSDEATARALSIMGKFHSVRTDVAKNHDSYLEEIYADRG